MTWYLAPALVVGRSEINLRWPKRDKESDGTIGDAAHQATRSDHNPNSRRSVNAADFDKDGIDVAVVIAAFEKHPSAHYWIYNREIADKDDGWKRRPYTGLNAHKGHLHLSIRQTSSAERDTRPWGIFPVPEAKPVLPIEVGGSDMRDLIFVKWRGAAEVYVGNGVACRHVPLPRDLERLQSEALRRGATAEDVMVRELATLAEVFGLAGVRIDR